MHIPSADLPLLQYLMTLNLLITDTSTSNASAQILAALGIPGAVVLRCCAHQVFFMLGKIIIEFNNK